MNSLFATGIAFATCVVGLLLSIRQFRAHNVGFNVGPGVILACAGVAAAIAALFAHAALEATAIALAACMTLTDVKTGYIPDAAIQFGALVMLVESPAASPAIAGALLAAGPLLTLYLVTNRRGVGLGDAKLAACCGAAVGPAGALALLYAAFVAGGVVAVLALLAKCARRGERVAFAPFLCFGLLVSIVAR